MAEYVDEHGNRRDLDAEQAAVMKHGWKFRVWYDTSDGTYSGRARKAWTLHICSTNADTADEARANLLDMIANPRP